MYPIEGLRNRFSIPSQTHHQESEPRLSAQSGIMDLEVPTFGLPSHGRVAMRIVIPGHAFSPFGSVLEVWQITLLGLEHAIRSDLL